MKRFAITMDEEVHRLLTIKAVRSGTTVGQEIAALVYQSGPADDWKGIHTMDDQVKKAIEPDKTKANRGRLSKGLGEVPGLTEEPKPTVQRDPYKDLRPVPKSGKK